MAKLASTRIYGSLIVDSSLNINEGSLNIAGGVSGEFLTYDGTWATPVNNYLDSASFNTVDGLLTLNRSGLNAVTVDLNGRYLTSASSLDPSKVSQTASYRFVTDTEKTSWNTAYGWGDHASGGYLTSASSLDPSKVSQTASYRFVTDTEKST
jgi:hypothetical protein